MATAEEQRQKALAAKAAKVKLQSANDVVVTGNLGKYDTKRLVGDFLVKTSQDNPAFIWPGSVARTMNGTHKPIRGYIRRLNEFYQRMDDGGEASNIQGRRCNFQIQPDGLTRSVGANDLNTQFFFNQDPAQLSVPIPGQSSYKLTLLFNREPEVASGKYLSLSKNGGGQVLKKAEGLSSEFDPMTSLSDAEYLLTSEYSPEWVTKLGVLADIMVLDAVIGQGISKETLSIIQQISQAQKDTAAATTTSTDSTASDDASKDEQDKTVDINATAADYWLQEATNNPNIGNTAFLVPTPVRIMLSNLMMVEGFVTSSDVNFFKFSKTFVPTQCRVDLQIQALYIGFAKTQTLLTTAPFVGTTSTPDIKPKTQSEIDVINATLDGIKSIYSKCDHHKGGKDLLNYILKNDPQQEFNFTLELNDKAIEYVNTVLWAEGGSNPVWTWDGKITINWENHITGASNTRQPTRTSATGGSYVTGSPSGFEHWGTKDNPRVLATKSGKIFVYEDVVYLGKTYRDQDHVIGDNGSISQSTMEAALWDMYSPGALSPRPFEQDKFRVQLEINIKLERGGTLFPVGQKVVFDKIVTCGEDVIFKGISLSNVSQT